MSWVFCVGLVSVNVFSMFRFLVYLYVSFVICLNDLFKNVVGHLEHYRHCFMLSI